MAIVIDGAAGTVTGIAVGGLPTGTIDASSLPSGSIIGMKQIQTDVAAFDTTATGSAKRSVLSSTYTPKLNAGSSKIVFLWCAAAGVGPASTNLDPWGHNFGLNWNGSAVTNLVWDVHYGFSNVYSYGPQYHHPTEMGFYEITSGYTAGTSYSYALQMWYDGDGVNQGVLVNRGYNNAGTYGSITSLTLMEIKV
jgi:hypothetical protein